MLMSSFAVAVRILTMIVSGGRVSLRFLVIAVIVIMGRLPMVMRRCLVVRSGSMMVFTGCVLLLLGHRYFLL
jgi:hypothetical protein